jgi:DNA-binding transcriptional regulator YhcF (GntR family)
MQQLTHSNSHKATSKKQFDTIPLYIQVRNTLAARIAGGEWAPGTMLPCEYTLSQEYGVSAGTTRKALNQLEDERILTRRQGRGTYVNDLIAEERERKAHCYCRAEQIVIQAGLAKLSVDSFVPEQIAECIWLTANELFARGGEYTDEFGNAPLRRARAVIAKKEAEAEEASQAGSGKAGT